MIRSTLIRRDFGAFPRLLLNDDWFDLHFRAMLRFRVDVHKTLTEVVVSAEIPWSEKKEDMNN